MTISEITIEDVALYLRLEPEDYNATQLQAIMDASTAYISSATAIPVVDLDNYPDFWLAFMVLCQDMYCNRSMVADKTSANPVAESILSLHRRNLV